MFSLRWGVVVAAVAGCGRFHFDDLPPDGATPMPDACTFGAFGPVQHLAAQSTSGNEWGAWISSDKLEIMFSATITAQRLIYRATRGSIEGAFSAPSLVDVGVPGSNDDPFITDDGLTMYFDSTPTTRVGLDIYRATRASVGDAFSGSVKVTELNSSDADTAPELSADELTVTFTSMRPGGQGDWDIYVATRSSKAEPFGPVTAISELNRAGFDGAPSVWGPRDSIVFVSDQLTPGLNRVLNSDRNGTYQPPTLLDPTLSAATGDEIDPAVSRDGTTVIFGSDRAGGLGGFDLYMAERACL